MVNLKKSKIGGLTGKVLGHHWASGGYFRPEEKGLKALLEMDHEAMQQMPVASIYGMLSFFRPYISDFAPRTEEIRKLLSASHATWRKEHTELVQDTVKRVLEGLPVMNFRRNQEVRLQVKVGRTGYTGVLL